MINLRKNGGNFTTRDSLIDWLFPYDESRLCYSYRNLRMFANKTLVNDAEAYFLPLNGAPNIITLKAKGLSQNSWYSLCSWKLFTNQKQAICVVIRKEVVPNRLEDLLALSNIYAQNFSVSEIIMEGFKTEQSKITK